MKHILLNVTIFVTIISITATSCINGKTGQNKSGKEINSNLVGAVADTTKKIDCDTISICSFNIQFLGHFKDRDDSSLANLVKNHEIVVIQELVAPPYDGTYPDGETYTKDGEAAEFLSEMEELGFSYLISSEDTGPGETNHKKTTATEWWITFYRASVVRPAFDLPYGFLASDRTNHPDYDRVPYAFAFRCIDSLTDFVLISVHLHPDKSGDERRKHELGAIAEWIVEVDSIEKDFIILGDMNIQDKEELLDVIPDGFVSLNDECRRTNTLINTNPDQGARPYDHVMYRPAFSIHEIDTVYDLEVINLIDEMRHYWDSVNGPYPGEPYDHQTFKQYYSDHHPVVFRLVASEDDD